LRLDLQKARRGFLVTGIVSRLKHQDALPDAFVSQHLLTLLPGRYGQLITHNNKKYL
jgi:hypothetical protein